MKVHQHLVRAVANAMDLVFFENQIGEKVIRRFLFENKKWGSRDRRFFAQTTYEIIRNYRLYLRLYCDSDRDRPDHFKLASQAIELGDKHLPAHVIDWPFEVRNSYPDGLYKLFQEQLGKNCNMYLENLNQMAPVYLRANTLKITRTDLVKALKQENLQVNAVSEVSSCIEVIDRKNLVRHEFFKNGFFEIQDGASQIVSEKVAPKPGDVVVDGCCGAGGKTLHLSALMENKGKIYAFDIHTKKLEELKKRIKRSGASNIEVRLLESTKPVKRLKGRADVVLLDVPCSGTGTIKRKPDIKWKLSRQQVVEFEKKQEAILESYKEVVKPGGRLVYSTCSLLPSENDQQIDKFLQNNPGYELLERWNSWPDYFNFDGFFVAVLRKN